MKPNRSITIALALFIGGIGLHKFYLGKPGWGIIYALFCWTFIPSIVALIEVIYFLFMDNEKFKERYWKE